MSRPVITCLTPGPSTRSSKPKFLLCFTAEMRLQGAAASGSAVHEGGMYELCLLQPHGMQAPPGSAHFTNQSKENYAANILKMTKVTKYFTNAQTIRDVSISKKYLDSTIINLMSSRNAPLIKLVLSSHVDPRSPASIQFLSKNFQ